MNTLQSIIAEMRSRHTATFDDLRKWANHLEAATAQPAEGVMVDCSAIPKHQWQLVGEPEPVTYSDELLSCWEQCRQCGLRRHVTREKAAAPSQDKGEGNGR